MLGILISISLANQCISVMAMTRGFSGLLDHRHQAACGVGGGPRKKNVNAAESTLPKQSSTGSAFECTTKCLWLLAMT